MKNESSSATGVSQSSSLHRNKLKKLQKIDSFTVLMLSFYFVRRPTFDLVDRNENGFVDVGYYSTYVSCMNLHAQSKD